MSERVPHADRAQPKVAMAAQPECLATLLNQLLKGERAGAKVARALAREASPALARTLRDIAKDEAWCCLMLTRQIERLGAKPSRSTGEFYERALRQPTLADRLDYLERGQAWVVRKLEEMLPEVGDPALHRDLGRMLEMHERNIARCAPRSES